jgi:hypothetical protein
MAFVVLAAVMTARASAGPETRHDADRFEQLLDELQGETDFSLRGGDGPLGEMPGIGARVVGLVGMPDTYDPGGTQSLRDAVIARWRRRFRDEGTSFLRGLQTRRPIEGRQDADLGDIHLSRDMADMRAMFFLPGRRIYEYGAMDGSFPPAARLLGDQGGIWAHPVKVLDGFGFAITEQGRPDWELTEGRHFAHRFYAARFHYERGDIAAVREDFAAENEPALFTQLTLRDKTGVARTVHVRFTARVNIRPAWRSGLPNDVDTIRVENGLATGVDRENALGRVVFGADRGPAAHDVQDNVVALTYPVAIPADGEVTLPFLILTAAPVDERGHGERLGQLMAQRDALLDEKAARYASAAFEGVQFECSDRRVTEAFQLAKLNLHMLTADLRPHMPSPYFYAGIPYYTQLLGCDNTLSIPGAVAAGFRDTARGTLECLADTAQRKRGRSPHEVATNNRHVGDGNAQEPPQFVLACWQYARWTGDTGFLRDVYPVIGQVMKYCAARIDDDGYIRGPALIEAPGMGSQKLDAACYLHAAYAAAASVASELGEDADAAHYACLAEELRARFDADWWMPEQRLWADSRAPGGERRMSDYWSVVFPLLTGLAEPERVQPALDGIERGWINQWGGVHTRHADISGQGSGVVTTNLFAMAAFRHGRADLGWSLLRKASRAPLEGRMLGGLTEVIPPGGSDILQLWSAAPLLGAVVEGLAGVRPHAAAHRVELAPRAPADLDSYSLDGLRVGEHTLSLAFRREGGERRTRVVHTSGPELLRCVFRAVVAPGEATLLNGAETRTSPTSGRDEATLEFTLEPGETADIAVGRADADGP